MAGEGAETLRKGHQAFNDRDRDTLMSVLAEDVVWHVGGDGPFAGTYEGRDAAWDNFFAQQWDAPVRVQDHDILDSGEHVVALLEVIFTVGDQERSWRVVEVVHYDDGQATERWAFAERQAELDRFVQELAQQAGGA